MVTGFDILGHDKRLQRHWAFRALAIIIDGIIVFVTLGIIFWLIDYNDYVFAGLFSSTAFFLYSATLEYSFDFTIGKKLAGLKIRPLTSDKPGNRIILRNVPKLFWFVLLPLDTVIGLATRGDPRQRMFDRIAQTTVIQIKEPDFHLHKKTETETDTQPPEEEQPTEERPGEYHNDGNPS